MSSPTSASISRAKKLVRAEFPEMSGIEPTISEKRIGSKGAKSSKSVFVLTFRKDVPLQGGFHISRAVRVTMGQAGEVIKLSSSK